MLNSDERTRLEDLSRPEWVDREHPCQHGGSLSRTDFLRRLVRTGWVLVGTVALVACRPEERSNDSGSTRTETAPATTTDCGDVSGLSAEERETRELYGYVETSSFPDSTCENCSLYLPPDETGGCGGCILFSGPVFADGYCDYWAPVDQG
ncbi:MAG: high-potential iron-sulfur protein [Balneolaceae bacterium]